MQFNSLHIVFILHARARARVYTFGHWHSCSNERGRLFHACTKVACLRCWNAGNIKMRASPGTLSYIGETLFFTLSAFARRKFCLWRAPQPRLQSTAAELGGGTRWYIYLCIYTAARLLERALYTFIIVRSESVCHEVYMYVCVQRRVNLNTRLQVATN